MRIEVCGGIASGKTTLAHLLEPEFGGAFEEFTSNPFFEQFYLEPATVAFETEITFLLQHYNAIQKCARTPISISDFAFALDLAYANVTLSKEDLRVFFVVWNAVIKKAHVPELLVRLRCGADEELRRIRVRGRPQEQRIERKYLVDIDIALDEIIKSGIAGKRVLEIDSESYDFAHVDNDKEKVKSIILDAITLK